MASKNPLVPNPWAVFLLIIFCLLLLTSKWLWANL